MPKIVTIETLITAMANELIQSGKDRPSALAVATARVDEIVRISSVMDLLGRPAT